MHPLVRAPVSAISVALFVACGVPVSDSKYEVREEPAAPFDRIVEAYASGSASCEECLRDGCQSAINACVGTAGCSELTVCVRNEANPAAQTVCASRHDDVTIDALAAHADTRECWVRCKSHCSVGRDWSCLGEYNAPWLLEDIATVRQSFRYLCEMDWVPGANVDFCTREGDCKVRATTDEAGTYTVDLPTPDKSSVAGWRGVRLVTGAGLVPHRLERNLPIWSDQVESTLLVSWPCAEDLLSGLQAETMSAAGKSVIAVQVFDCQLSGAAGVEVSVPSASTADVRYPKLDGMHATYDGDSSQLSTEGLALITGVPPGTHEFVAKDATSGEVIVSGHVEVPDDYLIIMYSLFPSYGP